MTHQPDVPSLYIEYYNGLAFDSRLIDAVIVEASVRAPTGILGINRCKAVEALYTAATDNNQDITLDWLSEAARIVWMNSNKILNANDTQP